MSYKKIVILGLGPGDPNLLTRQAWNCIQSCEEIYLRTVKHPAVNAFPTQLKVHTFDDLYESLDSFESVYRTIADKILHLGERKGGVVYAVPGHPFIAEATVPEICARAKEQGIPVEIIAGVSFLEPTFTALKSDPLPHTAIMDAFELISVHVPPFPPSSPVLIAQIYSREIAAEVKLTLMSVYPDEHPVKLVHNAGTETEIIEHLALFEIDRSKNISLMTCLYVPALEFEKSFETFQEIIARLRAPDGCPWDREQTHQSLRPFLLEETYELLDALDNQNPEAMQEELGDLLLQILLHAQIAHEEGDFNINDVLEFINNKMVNRHPHVFANVKVGDSGEVVQNWERIKKQERHASGKEDSGALDGVAISLPALSQAFEYQKRAARVGFDWEADEGVISKLIEEINEIEKSSSIDERAREYGDLLFTLVNVLRWKNIDPESALREANKRFRKRFKYMEQKALEAGTVLANLNLQEKEALWQEAKALE